MGSELVDFVFMTSVFIVIDEIIGFELFMVLDLLWQNTAGENVLA